MYDGKLIIQLVFNPYEIGLVTLVLNGDKWNLASKNTWIIIHLNIDTIYSVSNLYLSTLK